MIVILLFAFWDYSYNLDIGFSYDDNVYTYSQSYIDDFLNGIRSYRFPFETHDDLVTALDFRLLVRNKFFGGRTTTFSFDLNTDLPREQSKKFSKIHLWSTPVLREVRSQVILWSDPKLFDKILP